jgi:hypothetical protein
VGISINGNNITITGFTLEIINGANTESGVAYIIITPDGGVGSLPFMATGLPGSPTLFPTINMVQLPDGTALPSPNPVSTLIDAGGPGLPAKYSLTFYVNAGPAGVTVGNTLTGATDFLHDGTTGAPAQGVGTDKYTLIYRNSDGKYVLTAQKVGDRYSPASIAATAKNTTDPRDLASMTLGPFPWDWTVEPFAATIIDGSVDTRVDLFVRLGDPAGGDTVAYGRGCVGANTAQYQTIAIPSSPSVLPGAYGKVLSGNSSAITLRADQVAPSSNPWATPASPDTTLWVKVIPLL